MEKIKIINALLERHAQTMRFYFAPKMQKVGVKLVESTNIGKENLGEKQGLSSLKIKEVAALLGESTDVIRNWLKELGEFIPHTRDERSGYKLFDEKGIEAFRVVQQLSRKQYYTIRQIQHYFSIGGKEFVTEMPDAVKLELTEIRQLLEQQKQFNAELVSRLDRQQEYIEKSIKTRDEQLMLTIRSLQESKKQKHWFQLFWGGKNK